MNSEILSALEELRDELRALRSDIASQQNKDMRRHATKQRHALIREISRATGLGVTQAAATEVLLIWSGTHETPYGCERAVEKLRKEYRTPLCMEQIWRAIKESD